MKTRFLLFALFIFVCTGVSGQRVTISGKVVDAATQQPISQISVSEKNTNTGTITSTEGSYTLLLNKGKISIEIAGTQYETFKTSFELKSDTTLNVSLKLKPVEETAAPKKESKNNRDSTKLISMKSPKGHPQP